MSRRDALAPRLVRAVRAIGVLAAFACAPALAAATRTVAIDATAYSPAELAVKRGDTVIWKNDDPFPHTVTARDGTFDSKSIAAGKTWRYVARKSGVFAYYCTLHPTMSATLRVD